MRRVARSLAVAAWLALGLMVGLHVLSGWCFIETGPTRFRVGVNSGCLYVFRHYFSEQPWLAFQWVHPEDAPDWTWRIWHSEGWYTLVWPEVALGVVAVAASVRGFRRRPKGCTHCGYPLTGLPEGAPCPECGRLGVPAPVEPL